MDINTIRLLPEYDVLRLQEDLCALGNDRFRRQASYLKGRVIERTTDGWHALSLRSAAGDLTRTDPGPSDVLGYLDTPLLGEAPYIASVLSGLHLSFGAVRLMALEPGQSVKEHKDGCGLAVGWVRLHLPIVTNSGAAIVLGGNEHRWQPGELWYADFGRPHSVYNHGADRRVHLIIDAFVDATFLDLIPPEPLAHIDSSQIIFHRTEQPLASATLQALAGPISVPAAFLEPQTALVEELLVGLEQDREGMLSAADGQLLFLVGERRIALVHLGGLEFRMIGRTEATSIKLDLRPGTRQIRYRRRCGSDRAEVVRDY
jgi:hypothetical protein